MRKGSFLIIAGKHFCVQSTHPLCLARRHGLQSSAFGIEAPSIRVQFDASCSLRFMLDHAFDQSAIAFYSRLTLDLIRSARIVVRCPKSMKMNEKAKSKSG
ncbi:hypothetical protein VNO77_25950 [Canavalia gladiata]|uniref:Uncharacterized protein n=1 Tax=Canavalia gladiata TaxID=3824 RepID=A0AAN9Q5W9_CANGL